MSPSKEWASRMRIDGNRHITNITYYVMYSDTSDSTHQTFGNQVTWNLWEVKQVLLIELILRTNGV